MSCTHLAEEERAGCYTLIVLLLSCCFLVCGMRLWHFLVILTFFTLISNVPVNNYGHADTNTHVCKKSMGGGGGGGVVGGTGLFV